jgi:hypothetical protein
VLRFTKSLNEIAPFFPARSSSSALIGPSSYQPEPPCGSPFTASRSGPFRTVLLRPSASMNGDTAARLPVGASSCGGIGAVPWSEGAERPNTPRVVGLHPFGIMTLGARATESAENPLRRRLLNSRAASPSVAPVISSG